MSPVQWVSPALIFIAIMMRELKVCRDLYENVLLFMMLQTRSVLLSNLHYFLFQHKIKGLCTIIIAG